MATLDSFISISISQFPVSPGRVIGVIIDCNIAREPTRRSGARGTLYPVLCSCSVRYGVLKGIIRLQLEWVELSSQPLLGLRPSEAMRRADIDIELIRLIHALIRVIRETRVNSATGRRVDLWRSMYIQ